MHKVALQDGRYIDILLPGFPGGSPRGFLGWANIMAFHGKEGITVVDTGQAGDRPMLLAALKKLNIDANKVNKVFITHFHFDHINNLDLFPNAVVVMSTKEWDYARSGLFESKSDPFVPKSLIPYVATRKLQLVKEGDYLEQGVKIFDLPGHTPGVAGLLFEADKVFITGDALKNAHDLYFKEPGMCFDSNERGVATLEKIAKIAKVVIPGHDAPFLIRDGEIVVTDHAGVVINHYLDWTKKASTPIQISYP
ncbi:hypothetical protein SRRS_38100 [Sporomusa rhizae]|uniref:MBL fold metallo-hydrolase n=1 Tax=Sporomusa rhizae TaxID=357999 RepID=UPI00352B93F6